MNELVTLLKKHKAEFSLCDTVPEVQRWLTWRGAVDKLKASMRVFDASDFNQPIRGSQTLIDILIELNAFPLLLFILKLSDVDYPKPWLLKQEKKHRYNLSERYEKLFVEKQRSGVGLEEPPVLRGDQAAEAQKLIHRYMTNQFNDCYSLWHEKASFAHYALVASRQDDSFFNKHVQKVLSSEQRASPGVVNSVGAAFFNGSPGCIAIFEIVGPGKNGAKCN